MKNKLLKRVIGFMDERDEYQLQEINKDLAFFWNDIMDFDDAFNVYKSYSRCDS